MRGLALEGGGARGAYHIGATKALVEKGYAFDGFVGTSIGAINAAILAQGDLEAALELWEHISIEDIFENDEQILVRLADLKGLKGELRPSGARRRAIRKVIENRGVSTDKMKAFLSRYIDEEKLRRMGKDYGLVTISISDRRPQELMLEDIPQGQLFSYVMASASFPGFRPEAIEGKVFLDGAFYNNCPYDLLMERGYEEIIVIRTHASGVFKKSDNPKIKLIDPRDDLGNIMLFTPESNGKKIKIGYYDGLRFAENLRGSVYYIHPMAPDRFDARLLSLGDDVIRSVRELLDIPAMPEKRALFEEIIPRLGAYMRLGKGFDYTDFVVGLLEHVATQNEVERFCVYDYERLRTLAGCVPQKHKTHKIREWIPANVKMANKKKAANLLGKFLI